MISSYNNSRSHIRFCMIYISRTEGYLVLPSDFATQLTISRPLEVTCSTWDRKKWKVMLEDCDVGVRFRRGWAKFRDQYELYNARGLFFAFDRVSHFEVNSFAPGGCESPATLPPLLEDPAFLAALMDLKLQDSQMIRSGVQSNSKTAGSKLSCKLCCQVKCVCYSKVTETLKKRRKNTAASSSDLSFASWNNKQGSVFDYGGVKRPFNELMPNGEIGGVSLGTSDVVVNRSIGSAMQNVAGDAITLDTPDLQVISPYQFQLAEIRAAIAGKSVAMPLDIGRIENSTNEAACMLQLKDSFLAGLFDMRLPSRFAMKHLPLGETEITLTVGTTEEWRVMCSSKGGIAFITSGWEKFITDNELGENDYLKIEVPDSSERKWTVTMLKSSGTMQVV